MLKNVVGEEARFTYHVGAVALGFLSHPYKTMQEVVRQKVPGTVIFVPFLIWIAAMLLLRVSELALYGLVPFLGFWWFLFLWFTVFLFIWQVLLLYLFWRFAANLNR